MNPPADLAAALHALLDAWCERRAYRLLRLLLPAFPGPLALTDDWEALRSALRDVRALGRDDLLPGEADAVGEAIASVDRALRR